MSAEAAIMEHTQYDCTELHQTLESRRLELCYEKECRDLEVICELEKARQLRVQLLLLEDDNDDLHAQLAQDDDRIDDLERRSQELQEALETCESKLESAQGDLRIKSREIETLKAELNSLHGVTMDSTKLLTEKLTLARELSSLKPELDHLRSQVASHQTLLAEKLSLQRQLSTVQVELETEKRATQRTLAKEGKSQAEDAKIESRIENLQVDLAKERRERQRIEREAQKASTELENKNTALESRLDAFRNKLKTTKDQLKETQAALQKTETSAIAASGRAAASANPAIPVVRNPRKRAAVEMDADTMIGTPGDLPAAKRNKKSSTLPGEKSIFSVTPFLNRTVSVVPGSHASEIGENEGGDNEDLPTSPSRTSKTKATVASELRDKGKLTSSTVPANKPGILETAKASKAISRPLPARKPKAASILEKVAEEENDKDQGPTAAPIKPTASKSVPNETVIDGIEMKRKKRKLLGGGLGKTLFDEDEGDVLRGDKGIVGGVRGFGTLARGGIGGTKFLPRTALGASASGFGAISPLKKDRRVA